MINLRLQVEGVSRTLSHFDVVANNVSKVIDETSKEGSKLVQTRAKELAPKKAANCAKALKFGAAGAVLPIYSRESMSPMPFPVA